MKKVSKPNLTRESFGTIRPAKCYVSGKNFNVVMDPKGALLLAEAVLGAVNGGNNKIDLRIYATDRGTMNSQKNFRITVTSPKRQAKG